MPFTPKFAAQFAYPLLDQLIAIIQRDQETALATVDASLALIKEFHKGPGARLQMPYLTLAVDDVAFDRTDPVMRNSVARIALHCDVGNFDQEGVATDAYKYALALDRIISTASEDSLADFMTALSIEYPAGVNGTTSPLPLGRVKDVFIEGHSFSAVVDAERETALMRATLRILVEMEES